MDKQKQDHYRFVNKVDRTGAQTFNASSNNYKYGGGTRNRNYNQGRPWSFSNNYSPYNSQRLVVVSNLLKFFDTGVDEDQEW